MNKYIFACLVGYAAAQDDWVYRYSGKHWKSWSAEAKHTRLMGELFDDQTTSELDYALNGLFELDMNKTTCNNNDEVAGRTKFVHQQGVVASVKYESFGDHPYTGLFKGGADWGVARLSESGFFIDGHNESNPSVALKFLFDERSSENLVFMIDWNNQSTLDFFPKEASGEFKPFTTHPQPFKAEDLCSRRTILSKMKTASSMPFSSGTGHFSAVNTDGTAVEDTKFPFELMLIPDNNQVQTFTGTDVLEYLTQIGANETDAFFSVWARENPGSEAQMIGKVYFTSELVRSKFGDDRLFFRHESFNRDIRRLREKGDTATLRQWRGFEKNRPGYALPANFDDDMEIPEIPGDDKQFVEGSMLSTENLEGCPFAWLLQ